MFNVIIMLYAMSVDWLKQTALALFAGYQPISGCPAGIEGGAFRVFPAVRGRISCHSILAGQQGALCLLFTGTGSSDSGEQWWLVHHSTQWHKPVALQKLLFKKKSLNVLSITPNATGSPLGGVCWHLEANMGIPRFPFGVRSLPAISLFLQYPWEGALDTSSKNPHSAS